MKNILFLFAFLLNGCAYKTTVMAPQAIVADDYLQGESIYINRVAFDSSVSMHMDKRDSTVAIYFIAINENLKFSSHDFYIESNSVILKPIVEPYFIKSIKQNVGSTELELNDAGILIIKFDKSVQELDNLVLHIPKIAKSSGEEISNFSMLTFNKRRVWRAISPL